MNRISSRCLQTGTKNSFQTLPLLKLPTTKDEEKAFSLQLRHTCHTVGFFYIENHNVAAETYKNALASSQKFFDLPLDAKLSIDYRNSPSFRGYMDLGCENTAGKVDRREQIEFGVESESPGGPTASNSKGYFTQNLDGKDPIWKRLIGPNQWPNHHVPSLQPHITRYMTEMEMLSRRLMCYLALSLDLPRHYFDDTFQHSPNVQFKICRYPPFDKDEDDKFGVGAHTDSGYLSLLFQDDVGGLQVQNGDGDWIDAPPIDGTIVVNLGEMIQLITGGYYLATPHRVKNITYMDGQGGSRGRFSMPYFWNPRLDYIVSKINPLPSSLSWERPKPKKLDSTDSHGTAGNILFTCYGKNAFKSLARSHPDVMRRHHKDLLSITS